MRRIIKRLLKRDSQGNLHLHSVQELIDDEAGTIAETTATTFKTCGSCARPVENLAELRGCDRCGALCCDRCAVACAVCSRHLCPACRRGFAEKHLTVCAECLSLLNERQERQDRLLEEKAAFERLLTVYQEQARIMQYGMFHTYPSGDLLVQLAEVGLVTRLKRLERMIEHHERRP